MTRLAIEPTHTRTHLHLSRMHLGVLTSSCLCVRSLEATSQRTLQLVSGMFEKATMKADELVCVPKSHDDIFLS